MRVCAKNFNLVDWFFFVSMTLIHFIDMFSGYFSGFYCPEGSAYPQLCEAGSYCNQTGLEAPAGHCAAGYYCPKGSIDPYATLCPTGHYCPLGSPLPLPCPLGTMKSETDLFCYRLVIIRSILSLVSCYLTIKWSERCYVICVFLPWTRETM